MSKTKLPEESNDQSLIERVKQIRKGRTLLRRGPLSIDEDDQDPRYNYRVVKEKDLYKTEKAGWEVNPTEIHVGDQGLIGGSQGLKHVNLGNGEKGVLMRMEKTIRDELDRQQLLEQKERETQQLLSSVDDSVSTKPVR